MALIPTRVLIRLLTIHKVIELNFCATTCVAQFSVLDLLRKDASSEIKNERACIGDLSCISLILSGYRAINFTGFPSFIFSCTYVHAWPTTCILLIRIYNGVPCTWLNKKSVRSMGLCSLYGTQIISEVRATN